MNRATNRNTTVEFTSNPPPGAASTAPPTAGEGTSKTPSYSAPVGEGALRRRRLRFQRRKG